MERIGAAVIGGGVVGCAVLRELARAGVEDAFLFERLPYLGDAQSGRNSGVIHAGIYYAAGSAKARLCVAGNPMIYDFCLAHGVAHENVGKLVVAADDSEVGALERVFEQAKANEVPGVTWLDGDGARRYEPNVDAAAAIHCPTTGIVDAAGLTRALARLARNAGAQTLTSFEVTAVEPAAGGFAVTGRRGAREETFEASMVVNAAGLFSDRVARMVNPDFPAELAPLRGEYCKFNCRRRDDIRLVQHNVYPVPGTVDVGGRPVGVVGVHLTPTFELSGSGEARLGGTVTVGPEFNPVEDREDYETGRKDAPFFLAWARRFFPNLRLEDLEPDFAGIMANLRDGSDFLIETDPGHPRFVQLVGIDSPGLTCCLAIAREVRNLLDLPPTSRSSRT